MPLTLMGTWEGDLTQGSHGEGKDAISSERHGWRGL